MRVDTTIEKRKKRSTQQNIYLSTTTVRQRKGILYSMVCISPYARAWLWVCGKIHGMRYNTTGFGFDVCIRVAAVDMAVCLRGLVRSIWLRRPGRLRCAGFPVYFFGGDEEKHGPNLPNAQRAAMKIKV